MLKQLSTVVVALFLATGVSHVYAQDKAACEKQADEKKLHGAAKNSFVKKCSGGAAPAAKSPAAEGCEKQAGEKKLHGAAKSSFVKKCVADAK